MAFETKRQECEIIDQMSRKRGTGSCTTPDVLRFCNIGLWWGKVNKNGN